MLEIAVCEDEQADRDRLCSMLGVILDKQNIERRITCYGSGEELLEADAIFQLVFLDIMMDGKNGIETVKPSLSLPMEKILYFEYIKAKKRIRIVTEDVCYEYPGIFSALEGELRKEGFETSCRGILVNLRNVAKIRGYEVVLRNGGIVPLSQKRVTEFKMISHFTPKNAGAASSIGRKTENFIAMYC